MLRKTVLPKCLDPYHVQVSRQTLSSSLHQTLMAFVTVKKDYDAKSSSWLPKEWARIYKYFTHSLKEHTLHQQKKNIQLIRLVIQVVATTAKMVMMMILVLLLIAMASMMMRPVTAAVAVVMKIITMNY